MSDLDAAMRKVRTELELVSTVPAASGEYTTRGKAGSRLLLGVDAPHLEFVRAYGRARSDSERAEVIAAGEEEYRSLRFSRRPVVDCQTLEGRLLVGRDPRPVGDVAFVYGYSVRHVHRLRAFARDYESRERRLAA